MRYLHRTCTHNGNPLDYVWLRIVVFGNRIPNRTKIALKQQTNQTQEARLAEIVVYVAGVFDLFHRGHVELFRKAKALGDRLVVAVNSDELTASYKRRPVFSQNDRLEIVRSCKFVDEAFLIFDFDNTLPILKVGATKIVHGDDWTGESYLHQLRLKPEFVAKNQIEMVYVPYWSGVSTSEAIINAAQSYREAKMSEMFSAPEMKCDTQPQELELSNLDADSI
jgi:glycerol-3-phosphate cytidylyltransferase